MTYANHFVSNVHSLLRIYCSIPLVDPEIANVIKSKQKVGTASRERERERERERAKNAYLGPRPFHENDKASIFSMSRRYKVIMFKGPGLETGFQDFLLMFKLHSTLCRSLGRESD